MCDLTFWSNKAGLYGVMCATRPTDHFPKPVVSTTPSPAELDPNRPVQEEEEQEASVPHASSLAVDGTLSSTLCSETVTIQAPYALCRMCERCVCSCLASAPGGEWS